MRPSHHVFEVAPHAVLAAGLAALLLAAPPVARADALDTILDLVLQSIDPSLLDAKQLLKCAIGQGGLNEKALQVCGGGVAKAQADAYLASDSTAQTVVAAGVAASKRQWGKVIEIGGSRLILDLACTAAMPPGPVKSVLCSSISGELSKLAKPVLGGVVGALSSSPPDALKLVSILGQGSPARSTSRSRPRYARRPAARSANCWPRAKTWRKAWPNWRTSPSRPRATSSRPGTRCLARTTRSSPPKAYFKTYWAYTTHLGAWLKYIKGDAALAATARATVRCSSDAPLPSRMNGFGMASRETGHSRVPEPPDRITASMVSFPSGLLFARPAPARRRAKADIADGPCARATTANRTIAARRPLVPRQAGAGAACQPRCHARRP